MIGIIPKDDRNFVGIRSESYLDYSLIASTLMLSSAIP